MIEGLSITMNIYVCCYLALLFSVIVIILLKKRELNFLTKDYFKFLFTKERFCIYCLGTIALLLPAHFLEIHSWDYTIAIFQPILAYITAPWSVEVLCKLEKSKAKLSETFVALNMMMFTGSWSVELYLLYRDGYYMPDWLVNIPIGIVCFL
ncbi:MAG: hypothetical protein NE330_15390, partial [Lentisphaeraceae bacterium]|nr:hypothetical protein [Lentisphaeraceae bacterium]